MEDIPCNFCGRNETEALYHRDRNGLPVTTCMCKQCGLIYISPRMTPKWYEEYYKKEYRAQMARFKRKPLEEPDYPKMFENGRIHGQGLAELYKAHWRKGLTLEVGSSVGGVLEGIRSTLGNPVVGIEPSPSESDYARKMGVETHTTIVEYFKAPLEPAANVLCTQSLNHFLNPRFFLTWANEKLAPGGALFLEVMNFRHVWGHYEWIQRAIQIDHTYMFLPEVLRAFVEAAGFRLITLDTAEWKTPAELNQLKKKRMPALHISLVAEKAGAPFSNGPIPKLYTQVRETLRPLPNSRWHYWRKFRCKLPLLRKR